MTISPQGYSKYQKTTRYGDYNSLKKNNNIFVKQLGIDL